MSTVVRILRPPWSSTSACGACYLHLLRPQDILLQGRYPGDILGKRQEGQRKDSETFIPKAAIFVMWARGESAVPGAAARTMPFSPANSSAFLPYGGLQEALVVESGNGPCEARKQARDAPAGPAPTMRRSVSKASFIGAVLGSLDAMAMGNMLEREIGVWHGTIQWSGGRQMQQRYGHIIYANGLKLSNTASQRHIRLLSFRQLRSQS
jgi:hypothetical protein